MSVPGTDILVSLTLRSHPSEHHQACLWILPEHQWQNREQILAAAVPCQIDYLSVAFGDNNGQRILCIHSQSGNGTPHLPFPGWHVFESISNLFLPNGYTLYPPLHAECIRRILGIDQEMITWLSLGDNRTLQIQHISRRLFHPWNTLVQYSTPKSRSIASPPAPSPQLAFIEFVPEVAPTEQLTTTNPGMARPALRAIERWISLTVTRWTNRVARSRDPQQIGTSDGEISPLAQHSLPHGSTLSSVEVWESRARKLSAHASTEERCTAWAGLADAYRQSGSKYDTATCEILYQWSRSSHMHQRYNRLSIPSEWSQSWRLYRANGDLLALSRSRDKLLRRLDTVGLRFGIDMPYCLRFPDSDAAHQARLVRDWLIQHRSRFQEWVMQTVTPKHPAGAQLHWAGLDGEVLSTLAYLDLMLAWALTCVGAIRESRRLRVAAIRKLSHRPSTRFSELHRVHDFLSYAFTRRIESARSGRSPGLEPLNELLRDWKDLPRYAVRKFYACSRILDPTRSVNPYDAAAPLRISVSLEPRPDRLDSLLDRLGPLDPKCATNRYFSIRPLTVLDEIISIAVGRDAVLAPAVRSRMEDEEDRIRQRITHDVESAFRQSRPNL